MKQFLPYLLLILMLSNTASAMNDGNVIGTEATPLPDWEARIYPNPNEGVFNVMITGSSAALDVMVFNVIGEKVYQLEILADHGAKIDLSSLEKGLYVVQVVDENRGEVRTLRIQVK